jgi:hypothetical protein
MLLCWYNSSVVTGPRVALSLTSTMHDTLSLQCIEASLVHAVASQLHDDVDVGMSVVYGTACVSRRCLATCCGTLPSPSRAHSSTPPCCSTTTLRTLWRCGARWSCAALPRTLNDIASVAEIVGARVADSMRARTAATHQYPNQRWRLWPLLTSLQSYSVDSTRMWMSNLNPRYSGAS